LGSFFKNKKKARGVMETKESDFERKGRMEAEKHAQKLIISFQNIQKKQNDKLGLSLKQKPFRLSSNFKTVIPNIENKN
jgi:hypothetical protein